jgi:hypothetical protein
VTVMWPLRLVTRPLRRLVRIVRTVERVPDIAEAILVLPTLSRQLDEIRFATATLPDMHAEIARVRGDTTALPHIDETLARMALLLDRIDTNTAAVEELAQVMLPLRGAATRVGRFADRFPQRGAASARVRPGPAPPESH